MFVCIGENDHESKAFGSGETVEEAIKNWAYNVDWRDIEMEFNNYTPTIIEGKAINVTIKVPEPVPIFTIYS